MLSLESYLAACLNSHFPELSGSDCREDLPSGLFLKNLGRPSSYLSEVTVEPKNTCSRDSNNFSPCHFFATMLNSLTQNMYPFWCQFGAFIWWSLRLIRASWQGLSISVSNPWAILQAETNRYGCSQLNLTEARKHAISPGYSIFLSLPSHHNFSTPATGPSAVVP